MPAPLIAALAKWGFSLLAPVVASKGKEFIEDKLGVDLDKALGSEEGRIKLRQLEIEHQEFLINAAQASEVRALSYFQEEVKDRQSARESNAQIAVAPEAPWYQKALMPFLACVVTFGFFFSMGSLFYLSSKGIKLDDNSRDVIIYAFGVLSANFALVCTYLWGSSAGSRANQEAVTNLTKRMQS